MTIIKTDKIISDFGMWFPKSKPDKFIERYNSYDLFNYYNFNLGTLDSYYHLFEDLENKTSYFTGSNNQILVMKKRQKTFVFDVELCSDSDIKLLNELQKRTVIYSPGELPLPKEDKFNELIYNIPYILDPTNYKNSRQRNRRIKRPFKWLNNNNIEIINKPKSIEDIENLHVEWVRRKLENPKVYNILFPEKKYIYVFKRFLDNPDNTNYKGIFFYSGEELLSFRIISQDDKYGYDLTNIAKYWYDPNISNYCYIAGLKYFYNNLGIEYFNCGFLTHIGLSEFKMRYPHTLKEGYSYKKNKKSVPMKKLGEYL